MGSTRVVIGGDETAIAGRASPRREARMRRERLDEDGFAQAPRVSRRRSTDPWGGEGWQPVGATYPSPYGATYYSYGSSY